MDSNLYQLSRLKSRVFEFRFTARIKPTLIVVVFGSILDDDRSVGYHEVGPIADQEKVNSKGGEKNGCRWMGNRICDCPFCFVSFGSLGPS